MPASPLAGVLAQARRELELDFARDEERELELTAAERYARHPIAWINDHVWIASKFHESGRVRPVKMRLFPDQERTIGEWIVLAHLASTGDLVFANLLIEKSRQIGETWLFAALLCWLLHYHPGLVGLAMHQRAAEIDDGGARNTIKSLFGKIRYIDQRLDRAKIPGLGRLVFRPFSQDPAKVENPDNGHVLYGECQRDDPGRGGTFDYGLVDEAAFVAHGEKVHGSLDEACPNGKAYLSTVNGDDNVHARLCDEKPSGYTYLRLHWSAHPVYAKGLHIAASRDDPYPKQPSAEAVLIAAKCKLCEGNRAGLAWSAQEPRAHRFPGRLTSPWYDERVIGKTDEQVANELDIDRERALAARVFREFTSEVHVIEQGIPYDPDLEAKLELAWDFGLDCTSIIVGQDAPDEYRIIGILELGDLYGTTATPELVAAELRAYLIELGLPPERATPEWTSRIYAIGDPAGQSRTLDTGRPLVYAYRKLGFRIGRPPTRHTRTVDDSIRAVKRLLLGTPKPLRVCGIKAESFTRHMRNNVWPTDALGRRRLGATTPLDDEHNHACRAFAYLAVTKFPPPREQRARRGPSGSGDEEPPKPKRSDLSRRRGRQLHRRSREGVIDPGIHGGMSL